MIVREMLTLLGFRADDAGAKVYEDRLKVAQKKAETATTAMANGWQKVGRAIDAGLGRAESKLEAVGSRVQSVADGLGGLVGVLGGGLAFAGFAEITSRMSDFQSRLANAAEGTSETGESLMEKLRVSANTTYQAFDSVVDGFISMSPALSELGLSLSAQIDLSTAMADGLTVASVKGEQANRILMWLNRTMSSGVMSGEAFANIMEADSDVLDKMRQSLGLTTAQFQELGRGGKISAQMVVDYFQSAAPDLRRASENMTTTIADATVIFKNNFDAFIHGASESTGAANTFARAILWFAERPAIVGSLAIAALGAGMLAIGAQITSAAVQVAIAGVKIVQWMRTIQRAQLMAAITNPWLLLAIAIAAVGLAVQDVYTWMNGGQSIIGKWLGPWADFASRISAEWAQAGADLRQGFDNIGNAFTGLMDVFGNAAAAVGDWVAPLLAPVNAAMGLIFGEGGTLSTSILAAFPVLVILGLWKWLFGQLPESVQSAAKDLFQPIKDVFDDLVGWMGDKWNGLWGGIGGAISGTVGRIRGALSDATESAGQYGTTMGPNGVPLAAGAARSANPTTPAYARGTPNAARGVALVGEQGPELVRFRGGEEVVPADRTASFLSRLASRTSEIGQRVGEVGSTVAPRMAAGLAAFASTVGPTMAAANVPQPQIERPASGGRSVNVGSINAPVTVNIERGAIPEGVSEERVAQIIADRVDGSIGRAFTREWASAENHFTEMEG